jgi:hypothetical protein
MEVFKDINYLGLKTNYQVSNLGNIKNNKDLVLKPNRLKNGYLAIDMYISGIRYKEYIHRLVCMNFVSNPCKYLRKVTNHKNGIRTDNKSENLEWVTYLENAQTHNKKNKPRIRRVRRYDNRRNIHYYTYEYSIIFNTKKHSKQSTSIEDIIKFKYEMLTKIKYYNALVKRVENKKIKI